MKNQMESLEIAALVNELKDLEGGFIKKVYKPGEKEILLRVYVPGEGNKMLLFKVGKGLYLTEREKDNPMKPEDYVMLMRKFLGNAKIKSVSQYEFDRVVVFELSSRKKLRLIFEIFGKGNLILDGEEHILLPYRSESWSHRELKEGTEYKYPPSRVQPFELEKIEFIEILEDSDRDLVRTLAVNLNLGGKYAEEVCFRMDIDKNIEDFHNKADEIYEQVMKLEKKTYHEELNPHLIIEKGKEEDEIIDAVPFNLKQYQHLENVPTDTYNQALDLAFRKEKSDEEEEGIPPKLKRKLNQQQSALENLKEEVIENKVKAELIYQNYQKCEQILEAIHKAREEDRREEIFEKIKDLDFVVQLNDMDEYIILELSGEKDGREYTLNVKLDFRKDMNENAQHYYQKSKKCKRKVEGAKEAIEHTKKEIEEGKNKRKPIEKKKPTAKFWFDRFKWFITSKGEMVVAGKDTKTNEEVVKKYLEKYDRYAHADAGGAPSVVVKKEEDEISDKSLKEACQYAVLHSKEWKRGIAAGRAYWVKPNQVSKTAEAGESLPTGAFVIRGKRNYMDGLDLKAALVEMKYDGKKKVMCAPSYCLEDREDDIVKKYVTFIPGKKDVNDFAKDMSEYFKVPIDEIQKILPPGDVKVVEK
ncbi:MAG: ribosome rescue protein RqcH [Thermoplasmatota archaeon]